MDSTAINRVIDAMLQATDNPEVEVRITFDDWSEWKDAISAVQFGLKATNSLDVAKTQAKNEPTASKLADGATYTIELKNGSCIVFIATVLAMAQMSIQMKIDSDANFRQTWQQLTDLQRKYLFEVAVTTLSNDK